MRTSSRVEVGYFKLRFQQLDCGYKARTLNAVLIKIIWMSTTEIFIVSVLMRESIAAHFEVITQTTP